MKRYTDSIETKPGKKLVTKKKKNRIKGKGRLKTKGEAKDTRKK